MMLIGALFGFYVAVKGFRATDWPGIKKISIMSGFQRGKNSPEMKRLTRIWMGVMIAGFILTGIGLTIGIN